MTLGGLRPNTKYMVRVAIYDDYENRELGKSTNVIEVKTERELCVNARTLSFLRSLRKKSWKKG